MVELNFSFLQLTATEVKELLLIPGVHEECILLLCQENETIVLNLALSNHHFYVSKLAGVERVQKKST